MFERVRPVKKARLNIAPLLDMIFILLIFFVVSTSFSKLPGILVNRPDGSVTDQLPPNNLLVGIDTKGRFFINKKEYDTPTLKETLSMKYRVNPRLSVVIVADESSQLKYTVQVMDLCKQVGITELAIAEEWVQ